MRAVGLAAVGLVAGMLLAGCDPVASANPGASGPVPGRTAPSSMAALGDSITTGFASCVVPAPCPRNSWATGDSTLVNSHYRRILAVNPAIQGHARNFAAPNAMAADLVAQASSAVAAKVEYVTVLVGANDVCHGSFEQMTSVPTFRAQVDQALAVLRRGLPTARVLVVSIPNIYRVWEVGHGNKAAVRVWSAGVCPALLANPTSTAAADVNRRQAVRQRIDAYGSALSAACTGYGSRCRTDGNAAHLFAFDLTDLAVTDFFHPNAGGQADLARVSWPGRIEW
jgi:lysophospholipase L1-like esterase